MRQPGCVVSAMSCTSCGCTTARFLLRFLNMGSGWWKQIMSNLPWLLSISTRMRRKSTFALLFKNRAFCRPERNNRSSQYSTITARISNPMKFVSKCASALRRIHDPLAQPMSTMNLFCDCENESSNQLSWRSTGIWCIGLRGFTCCRDFREFILRRRIKSPPVSTSTTAAIACAGSVENRYAVTHDEQRCLVFEKPRLLSDTKSDMPATEPDYSLSNKQQTEINSPTRVYSLLLPLKALFWNFPSRVQNLGKDCITLTHPCVTEGA
jgi:hypothetical protein